MNQEINKGRKTMQFLKNIYFTVITMLFGAFILIKGIFRGLDVHKALKLHEQGKLDDALKNYEKFTKNRDFFSIYNGLLKNFKFYVRVLLSALTLVNLIHISNLF